MKKQLNILLVVAATGLYACKEAPKYFIGKWQIKSLELEQNESVDLPDNWMHLKDDGTFESYDGNEKKNERGSWTFNSEENKLLIDGEGEQADSEWILSLRNDTLIFHSEANNLNLIAIEIE